MTTEGLKGLYTLQPADHARRAESPSSSHIQPQSNGGRPPLIA
jgi:hypothetical protein